MSTILVRSDDWLLESFPSENGHLHYEKAIHRRNKQKMAQLFYELDLSKDLQLNCMLQPVAIEQQPNFLKLIYRDQQPFISLEQMMTKPMTPFQFLRIAIQLTNCFIELHHECYVFHNLHPKHILINPQTYEVKLFNFEYTFKQIDIHHLSEQIQLQLTNRYPYISPEETGRVDENIDFQSDLYSLGVLFYEMMTHQLPYSGERMAYIQRMLTTEPVKFEQIGLECPAILEEIILKCISKEKRNRYASAIGLKADLQQCWHRLTNNKQLKSFPLASKDIKQTPHLVTIIPEREQLVQELLKRVESFNERVIYVIDGQKNIGKTSLLNRCIQQLSVKHYTVLTVRANTGNGTIPSIFIAFREALNALMKSKVYDEYWQATVSNIILPELLQKYMPELNALTPYLRFNDSLSVMDQHELFDAMLQLLEAFKEDAHETIFCIDDWHFLDEDSMRFIEYASSKQWFKAICTTEKIDTLPFEHQLIERHTLQLVSLATMKDWLVQSMPFKEDTIEQCCTFLIDISQGNPYYVREIFQQLYMNKIIGYHLKLNKWYFDYTKLSNGTFPTPQNYFDTMFSALNEDEHVVLKFSASLGRTFSIRQLLQIIPMNEQTIFDCLIKLLNHRFIIIRAEQLAIVQTLIQLNMVDEIKAKGHFFNEQIHAQYYETLEETDKQMIHQQIYMYLHAQGEEALVKQQLLLHHMQYFRPLFTESERCQYITLSNTLCEYTIRAGLYRDALIYVQNAYELLLETDWIKYHAMAFQTTLSYANALYLMGLPRSEEIFESILQQDLSDYDRLCVYNEKLLFMNMKLAEQADYMEMKSILNMAQQALQPYRISITENVSPLSIMTDYLYVKRKFQRLSDEAIIEQTLHKNTEHEMVLRLLLNISGIALILNELLYTKIIFTAIKYMLKHGHVEFSSVFYGNFANILVSGFKDFKLATRFGQLSIRYLQKHDNIMYRANIYLTYGISVSYLSAPYETSIYYLNETKMNALNNSLHKLFISLSSCYIALYSFYQGITLADVITETEEQIETTKHAKNQMPNECLQDLLYWCQVLTNNYIPVEWNRHVSEKSRGSQWQNHLILRLKMSYLLMENERAMECIKELEQFMKTAIIVGDTPQYYFYRALVYSQQVLKDRNQKKLVKEVQQCVKQLEKYAQMCPQNFEHMYMLIQAQYAAIQKKDRQAKLYFDRAIQLAHLQDNLGDEAIAMMVTAQYYERFDRRSAEKYFQQAIQLFMHWGATRVVQVFSRAYPHLQQKSLIASQQLAHQMFDIEPIVKLYEHIAKEETIEGLVALGLFEISKHLDATNIYLLKVVNNIPMLVSSILNSGGQFKFYDVPKLILPASIDQKFINKLLNDHTVMKETTTTGQSKVAIPIFNKGKVGAVIYASNTTLTAIFTHDKINLVKILGTQLLVAVENFERQLYLEKLVNERTSELSQINRRLEQTNDRLNQNEQERTHFLQQVSHDLRSPITSVLGYVEALQNEIVTDPTLQKKYLERSKNRLLALKHLIDDLFQITLAQNGRIEYHKTYMSLGILAVGFDETLTQELAETNHYELQLGQYDGNATLYVDRYRIEQVLRNIASNIRKYANGSRVICYFESDKEFAKLVIQDFGPGIAEKDLPFIFDMHFIGSNHTLRDAHGIGLSICKQIVEAHGGTLDISSKEGKGTTLTMNMPILQSMHPNSVHEGMRGYDATIY